MEGSLPIFIHYPKCGGTSVMIWSRDCLFYSAKEAPFIQELRVLDNHNKSIFTLFVFCEDQVQEDFIIHSTSNSKIIGVKFTDLSILFTRHRINIFSAMINPSGVQFLEANLLEFFLKSYTDRKSFTYFMSFRDPLDREISLFTYLNSEQSKRELTHKAFGDIDIQTYLSDTVPDSWLITEIKRKNSEDISEGDLFDTIQLLNRVTVCDISILAKTFEYIFYKTKTLPLSSHEFMSNLLLRRYNITQDKNIGRQDISQKTRASFQHRKFFELELHNFLEKKSQELELAL